MKVGYVRVSTTDQNLDLQLDALEKTNPRRQTTLIDKEFYVGDGRFELPTSVV